MSRFGSFDRDELKIMMYKKLSYLDLDVEV